MLSVVITFGSTVQERIAAAVQNHYAGLLDGKVVSWELQFRRVPELKSEEVKILSVRSDDNVALRGARVCWVAVEEKSKRREIPVTVTLKTVERIPVAAIDIQPRTPLSLDLVEWREMPTGHLGQAHILSADELAIGWAKVRIPAGTILTSRKIVPQPAVTLGQNVDLVIRVGRIEAKAAGKALEDGRVGENIRVLNTASGFRLRGKIASNGEVIVE